MNKAYVCLKKIIVCVTSLLSVIILLYLTAASMNATVYVSEYEKCFYCKDNPIVHICTIALVTVCFILPGLYHRKISGKREAGNNRNYGTNKNFDVNRNPRTLYAVLILAGYVLILVILFRHLKLMPIFDQNHVFQIGARLVNYDYTDFQKGGYADKWTNQWGYLLFLMEEFRLFGIRNADAVYITNIIFIAGVAWNLYGFGRRFLRSRSVSILIAGCLYVPLWSFVTFVYGNIPSWFFSMLAINLLYDYFEEDSLLKGILSTLFISISIMLKTTQLILFIAFLIYLIIRSYPEKRKHGGMTKRIALLLLCVLFYVVSGIGTQLYMEKITGMELGKGVPRVAHIAMAMHENSDSSGWYDGYNERVYEDSGYDYTLAKQAATEDLMNSLQQFRANPIGAVGFFSRKVLSQWIEPTCESIFILLNRHTYSDSLQYNPNDLAVNRLGSMLVQVMNLLQTAIYFGAFMFFSSLGIRLILSTRSKKDFGEVNTAPDEQSVDESPAVYKDTMDELFAGLAFVGAFLFFTFWEANSQYALLFVQMLIPCAVCGYSNLSDGIIKLCLDRSSEERIPVLCPTAAVLVLILIAALLPDGSSVRRLLAPDWSTGQYTAYLAELLEEGTEENTQVDIDHTLYATRYDDKGAARFPAGRYYVMPADAAESCLVPSGERPGVSVISGNASDDRIILTSRKSGYTFRFQSTQLVMDVENASTSPGTRVQQYEQNGDMSQIFCFEPADEVSYFITYADGLVLTGHEDGSVTVEYKEEGNLRQRWRIISDES